MLLQPQASCGSLCWCLFCPSPFLSLALRSPVGAVRSLPPPGTWPNSQSLIPCLPSPLVARACCQVVASPEQLSSSAVPGKLQSFTVSLTNKGAAPSLPLALSLSVASPQNPPPLTLATPSPLALLAPGASSSVTLLGLLPNTTLMGSTLTGAVPPLTPEARTIRKPHWSQYHYLIFSGDPNLRLLLCLCSAPPLG